MGPESVFGFGEASRTVFCPSGVDFYTVRGSHFGAKLGQKSTFPGYKNEAPEKTIFEGLPSTVLEAKSGFLEVLLGGFWGSNWNWVESQK